MPLPQTFSTASPARSPSSRPLVPAGPATDLRTSRLRRFQVRLTVWVLQVWLALFYLGAGYGKLSEPLPLLGLLMDWPDRVAPVVVRLSGTAEILLALLSLLPWRSQAGALPPAWPNVALLAWALGFLGYHTLAGHPGLALTNLVLAAIAAAILRGRTIGRS